MKRVKSIILIILVSSTLLTGCSLFSKDTNSEIVFDPVVTETGKLIVDGMLVPKQTSQILASVNEQIETLFVSEGDSVNQGDLLLKFEGGEAVQAKISAAELEILQAKTDLDALNRLSAIELNKARINLAQAELALIKASGSFQTF